MKKKKVYVGLSGGVDSAVAAALLKKQGFDVRGVFLREYDMSFSQSLREQIACSQEEDRASAIAVAAHLGIPFEEWDFRSEYKENVVDYLFDEYAHGGTPNPDVMCNKHIKFGSFLTQARERGADYIATGHYAKKRELQTGEYGLAIAKDKNKDQTYFLYTLSQEQLRFCLFPLANLTKPQVRAYAKKLNLPNWNRKDSQGICFVGKIAMKDFLQTALLKKPGPLMTKSGERIGTHEGAGYYTIGQRHGLGYQGGDRPYFVVDKDIENNIVYVAQGEKNPELYKKELTLAQSHWTLGSEPDFPLRCKARIRYRQPLQSCVVTRASYNTLHATFDRPQRAVTSGQAVVFYLRTQCLGGGIIE